MARSVARAIAATALLASAVLASAARADDPPPIAASELFLRARDRIAAQHLPRYYTYRERLKVRVLDDDEYYELQVALRVGDGAKSVVDAAHRLISESLSISPVAYARVVSSELPPSTTSVFKADANDEPTATTIGRVRYRSSIYYIVSDAGTAKIDGVRVRHLRFVPRMDPEQHPLREAWIDPVDYRLVQALVAGRLGLPESSLPIDLTVTFREIGGVTTIAHLTGDGEAQPHRRFLTYAVDQSFDELRAAAIPEASWLFPKDRPSTETSAAEGEAKPR
jgi:hypothetical protein